MGIVPLGRKRSIHHAAAILFICGAAGAASAQQTPEKPPETAPAQPPPSTSPVPTFAVLGPSREIKLSENTWFRFGAQVQAWYRIAQDRIIQPDGSDGSYAMDFYCRRCRFFATGSVVRNVYFNVLFEAGTSAGSTRLPPATRLPVSRPTDAPDPRCLWAGQVRRLVLAERRQHPVAH